MIYRGFGDPEPLDFLTETFEGFEGDIITNPPYSIFEMNVSKLMKRYPEGFDPEKSIHRPEYENGGSEK